MFRLLTLTGSFCEVKLRGRIDDSAVKLVLPKSEMTLLLRGGDPFNGSLLSYLLRTLRPIDFIELSI